ncbi:hypothetical protein [Baaleninema sp.]|uniref:hypothetical protein n=1 Tax=Baaleninema sp. TaxID=3101197 RepID=UPI003D08EA8A
MARSGSTARHLAIRDWLDAIALEQVFLVFEDILSVLDERQLWQGFRFLADTRSIAMDSTKYFSSTPIHCL